MVSSLFDISVNFYPRPPRGGRLRCKAQLPQWSLFLSTPSARRATYGIVADSEISVFLSTPSARRATVVRLSIPCDVLFLSTPSARRATSKVMVCSPMSDSFLSTPSARRATD